MVLTYSPVFSLCISSISSAVIYRETDIISDDVRVNTDYYKKVYKPNNWHYALQIVIARHKKFLGTITFYRTIGKEDFHYDDIFVLDMLKDHLAYRLEQFYKSGESGDFSFSFDDDYDDGALLLLNSCILGIKSIKDEYGSQYINITDQEV